VLIFKPPSTRFSTPRDILPLTSERRAVEDWITLKEAGDLLSVSAAAIRYRALKKRMYKHRREQREYGETVVVSTQSLIEKHPELKEELEDDLKPPVKEDTPTPRRQFVSVAPAPDEGLRSVSMELNASAEGRAVFVDTDRLRSLLDELEEMQRQAQEIKRREQEIKAELKTLMERL
jgi:hypothetical protein